MLVVKLPPNIFSIILDLSQIKQALPLSKLHMAFAATRYWILIGNYSLDVFYKLRAAFYQFPKKEEVVEQSQHQSAAKRLLASPAWLVKG